MKSIKSHRESNSVFNNGPLATLPDGRVMTYAEIIREAETKRSQAIGNAIRALFGFATSSKASTFAVRHPSGLVGQH